MPAGKTYVKIASQTLSGAASSVTFSNLPQNYTDLVLVFAGQNTTNNTNYLYLRFNGDSGSNYSGTQMRGTGSAAQSGRYTNATEMYNSYGSPLNSEQQNSIIQIQNYSNAAINKTVLFRTNTAGVEVNLVSGLWRSTAAITSILIQISANNFAAGSTFTIYGIECAKSPKADGGIITRDGTYYYHTFLSSGTFTPNQSLTVDYLVVAGGGSGGNIAQGAAGGGGAGGLRCTVGSTGGGGSLPSALSLTANAAYTITVGAGGTVRANGNNSSLAGTGITTVTSTGGGQGGSRSTSGAINGATGGSGGGGSGEDSGSTGGSGTANEGYAGGTGGGSSINAGGGGGGAGAAGSARAAGTGTITGGNGGNGVTTSISGVSLTYAGGGGGGSTINGGVATGGSGGGGNGGGLANTYIATSGTANTGGGGGGGGNGTGRASGNGGSGIVIIRYAV